MTEPALRTIKRLFALSRNRCAFPGCVKPIVQASGTVKGRVCHIEAQNPGGPRYNPAQSDAERHAFENLMLLCAPHHATVDDEPEQYPVAWLHEHKARHERDGDADLSPEAARHAELLWSAGRIQVTAGGDAQVMVGSPGAVQAQQFIYKAAKGRAPEIKPTVGAIGHDLAMRNYTLHLIERYNHFQKIDTEKPGPGKYVVIHKAIKKEFGSKWDFVPQNRFEEMTTFLQRRILKSKFGRIFNARDQKCFSTFQEWETTRH